MYVYKESIHLTRVKNETKHFNALYDWKRMNIQKSNDLIFNFYYSIYLQKNRTGFIISTNFVL